MQIVYQYIFFWLFKSLVLQFYHFFFFYEIGSEYQIWRLLVLCHELLKQSMVMHIAHGFTAQLVACSKTEVFMQNRWEMYYLLTDQTTNQPFEEQILARARN